MISNMSLFMMHLLHLPMHLVHRSQLLSLGIHLTLVPGFRSLPESGMGMSSAFKIRRSYQQNPPIASKSIQIFESQYSWFKQNSTFPPRSFKEMFQWLGGKYINLTIWSIEKRFIRNQSQDWITAIFWMSLFNNYRSYLTLCIKNNMTNYVDVVPNTLATNIISEAYPSVFSFGGRERWNRHGISWFPHSSGKCWDRKAKTNIPR